MSASANRYAMLKDLDTQANSESRRELLRKVTEVLAHPVHSQEEISELDGILSVVAREYSVEVRTQFARLVAASNGSFHQSAEAFSADVIDVAAPVLKHSRILSEDALLRVVARNSQPHMLAITRRSTIGPRVSHALAEKGNDEVLISLLANQGAQIADNTYEVVARRAGESPPLQAPLVRRPGVPVDLLHDLYARVESDLRREIVEKFDKASTEELEKAFERSRSRIDRAYRKIPDDFASAQSRIKALNARGGLKPANLVALQREGVAGRTAFTIAFAQLVDVEFDVVLRTLQAGDIDTMALLCRGANLERAIFVTLAIGLDKSGQGAAGAEKLAKMYESVPVQAAQRALRFWKVRAAG